MNQKEMIKIFNLLAKKTYFDSDDAWTLQLIAKAIKNKEVLQ